MVTPAQVIQDLSGVEFVAERLKALQARLQQWNALFLVEFAMRQPMPDEPLAKCDFKSILVLLGNR